MKTPSKPTKGGPVYLKLADILEPRHLVLNPATQGWTDKTADRVELMLQAAYAAGVQDSRNAVQDLIFEMSGEDDWVSKLLENGV